MAPECPTCGLVFSRVPGHWLGSWFLNVCVVQTLVIGILAIGVGVTWPDPPIVWIGIGAGLSALVAPLAFFPISRTLWTAIDLVMRPLDFDDGVAPGFLLEDDLEALVRDRGADDRADPSASGRGGGEDLHGPLHDDR